MPAARIKCGHFRFPLIGIEQAAYAESNISGKGVFPVSGAVPSPKRRALFRFNFFTEQAVGLTRDTEPAFGSYCQMLAIRASAPGNGR